eukprot:196302-Hanusia_phi.AAC.1
MAVTVGWDGRAAFAELVGLSIAVSFCSSLVAETYRLFSIVQITEGQWHSVRGRWSGPHKSRAAAAVHRVDEVCTRA